MLIQKILLSFILLAGFSAYAEEPKSSDICSSKEACLTNPDCLCWCSVKCGWRKKKPDDHPVYIENDPYGKHCYCKQWDFDHYEDNCINRKHIKQPSDAK